MNIVINNRQAEIERLLAGSQSVAVMGMPGSGISIFLKELAQADSEKALYIDVFGLPSLSGLELFRALARSLDVKDKSSNQAEIITACTKKLEQLLASHNRITFYLAGFDQLLPALDAELLQGLHAIARSKRGSVKLVFGLCVSLKKLIPDTHFDSGLRLFGSRYYLGSYSKSELEYFLTLYGPTGWQNSKNLDEKIELSGGHFQLLLTLLADKPEITDDAYAPAQLLFRNMYHLLLGPQRTIVRNIAQGVHYLSEDEYLVGIGMVQKTKTGYALFSPLFANYLSNLYAKRLPAKERRLYLLLKKHIGQVVSKQDLMDIVWQDEIVSEWALNALVYRLRKHPAFVSKGFLITNHKKQGYSLQKS